MTRSPIAFRVVATCVVGFVLATQVDAQRSPIADSLGLQVLNRLFQIMPVTFSIDLTRGQLTDSVPELGPIGTGTDHTVFGRYQNRGRVAVQLTYRHDSGEFFRKTVTRHATPENIDVHASSRTAEFLLGIAPNFRNAVAVLGPPESCDRDTVVSDEAGAIFLSSLAMWTRGEVTVTFGINFNAMEPLPKNREFAPRFSIGYGAMRSSDDLHDASMPTRHDWPCIFTDDEIRTHAIPLDSAEFDRWQKLVRHLPPRPPLKRQPRPIP